MFQDNKGKKNEVLQMVLSLNQRPEKWKSVKKKDESSIEIRTMALLDMIGQQRTLLLLAARASFRSIHSLQEVIPNRFRSSLESQVG